MNKRTIQLSVVATSIVVAATVALTTLLVNDENPTQSPRALQRGVTPETRDAAATPETQGASAAPVESIEVVHAAAVTVPEHRDWLHSFNESMDNFALAQELVVAGKAGDARAQLVLGRVLLECEIFKRSIAQYKQGTLAERAADDLATRPYVSERSRRNLLRQVPRCERLLAEDPFAGHDLPDEARGYRYWANRALESGDPLAVMERAVRSIAGRGATSEAAKDPAFRANLLSDVRHVAFSGDAVALFSVGGVLSHPSVVADPTYGYAWQVAACEMGYDCSKQNPAVGFGCTEDGTCDAGETFLDVMQRDLGAVKFAEIYASAQDIEYRITTNDWDGLQQYVQIKE